MSIEPQPPDSAAGPRWRRTFYTVWAGQAASLLGSSLVQFALVWWLTIRTDSATVLAAAMLVSVIPTITLSPLAGAFIDRHDRRRIMIAADGGIALVTAGLAALAGLGLLQPWHIYIALALRSIGSTFHWPAMQASTTLMVPAERLARVGGLNQALAGLMGIIAPALGALLMEALPLWGVLTVDIATAMAAIGTLLVVSIPSPAAAPAQPATSPWRALATEIGTGFRYVLAWRGLWMIMLLAALLNMVLNPMSALLPLLVTRVFQGGALQFGLLDALFSAGLITGGLALSTWGGFRRRVYTAMFGLLLMGGGILMMAAAPASAFWLVLAGSALTGFANSLTNGPMLAVVQASTAPEMQGRVFTTMNSLAGLMSPLGLILAGPIADALGIRVWFWVSAVFCYGAAVFGFLTPAVRNIERGHAAAAQPGPANR